MRYAKGTFVITAGRDIPLLRLVRNCRFVSHSQLFELLQYEGAASCRRTFNWRVQRLLNTFHIERLRSTSWQGFPVYSISQNGLRELESQGEFSLALHSRTRRMPDSAQVFHALELNSIRLALTRTALLISWRSEVEISSSNLVLCAYQKDYDAIVKVWLGSEMREFALEYERSLKSARQYAKVRTALEAERQIACVLYLAPNADLLQAILYQLTPLAKSVGFAIARSLKEQLLATLVSIDANETTVTLERFLQYAHPLYASSRPV